MADRKRLEQLCHLDVMILVGKDAEYGESWKKRGGVGAFMMLARKWDRLETLAQKHGWDVFAAGLESKGTPESLEETIGDLRRYLLLVEDALREGVSARLEVVRDGAE